MIDSKYLDINELKANLNSSTNFNIAHLNIASLDLHIDELRLTISRLKHKFNVLGISEHKIKTQPGK